MTFPQFVAKADRLAKKNERDYFVVIEAGEYDVTDDEGLDTFYCGISQDHILYCSADAA